VPAADRPSGRIKRHWTAEEMRVLVAHYLNEGAAGCAARLPGRLPRHIHTKAISMGLRRQKAHAATRESTDYIDAAIRRFYREPQPRGALTALAKRLSVTRQWVSTRAATLGVLPVTRPETQWTPEELAIVEANAHRRADAIAKLLRSRGYQRTAGAVGQRLKIAGFDRLDPDVWTCTELARCMGVDSHVPLRWIERHGLKARKVGPGRTGAWEIRRKDLRDWLIRSAEWDHRRCPREWLVDLLAGPAN
jgi:hypothetical protein